MQFFLLPKCFHKLPAADVSASGKGLSKALSKTTEKNSKNKDQVPNHTNSIGKANRSSQTNLFVLYDVKPFPTYGKSAANDFENMVTKT